MKFSRINKKKLVDYLLMFLLISISGNPFFSGEIILLGVFSYGFFLFIKRKKKVSRSDVKFLLLIVVITFLQSIKFSFFPIVTLLGVYIRILTAYFVIKVLDVKFIMTYIKIVYFIALSSLLFYVISIFAIDVLMPLTINTSGVESLYPRYSVYGFFTIILQSTIRNPGPFWEPGAFAGYLILAFIFNFFSQIKGKNKIGIVLLIAILTTMSTTAYLSIFIFSFFTYYKKINNIVFKLIGVGIIIYGGYYSFTSIEFLGKKIEYQISFLDEDAYLENNNSQRFLNIMRDVQDFSGHEIIGRGFHSSTRYLYEIENQIRTVGITDIIVKMGLPFFIIMMFMLYNSINKYLKFNGYKEKIYVLGMFLSILILLMSEVYFNFPLIWSLLFLKSVYTMPKRELIRLRNQYLFNNENRRITHLSQP